MVHKEEEGIVGEIIAELDEDFDQKFSIKTALDKLQLMGIFRFLKKKFQFNRDDAEKIREKLVEECLGKTLVEVESFFRKEKLIV